MSSTHFCHLVASLASGLHWAQTLGGTSKVTWETFFSQFLHCQVAMGGGTLYQKPGFSSLEVMAVSCPCPFTPQEVTALCSFWSP